MKNQTPRTEERIKTDLARALESERIASARHDKCRSKRSLTAYAAASETTNELYRELATVRRSAEDAAATAAVAASPSIPGDPAREGMLAARAEAAARLAYRAAHGKVSS